MANDAQAPAPPTQARSPRGINHLVLNVRDLEASHRFWTDILGFRCVAERKQVPGRVRPKMRLYETDTLDESPPDPLRLIGDGHFWSGQRFVTFLNPSADGRMQHVASRLRLHKRTA